MIKKRPLIGIGVIVIKDGRILMGKRKNVHGEGTWSLPGGHLEFGESLEECAKREVFEETGIIIKNVRVAHVTNDIFKNEDKHYVTIFMISDYNSGVITNLEPEKCEDWYLISYEELINLQLFLPLQNLLAQINYLSGKQLFFRTNESSL